MVVGEARPQQLRHTWRAKALLWCGHL